MNDQMNNLKSKVKASQNVLDQIPRYIDTSQILCSVSMTQSSHKINFTGFFKLGKAQNN